MGANISYGYKSFSGQDALVYMLFQKGEPVLLGSLTTISWSLYRAKKQIVNIGSIDPNGVAKGIRVVAGTLVFNLISEHWLEALKEIIPNMNIKKLKADELPPFDIMIVCGNEYGASISKIIYGVSITEEGGVVSVEDLFIENTAKYIARDIDNFEAFKYNDNISTGILSNYNIGDYSNSITYSDTSSTVNTLNSLGYKTSDIKTAMSTYATRSYLSLNGLMNTRTRMILDDIKVCKVLNNRLFPVNVYNNLDELKVVSKLYPFDTVEDITDKGEYLKTELGYVYKKDILIQEPYKYHINGKNIVDITNPNIDDINITLDEVSNDVNVKYSINKIYEDTCSESIIKQKKVTGTTVFELKEFKDLLLFNTKHGFPTSIEFIVYPIGYRPIKKIVQIEGV